MASESLNSHRDFVSVTIRRYSRRLGRLIVKYSVLDVPFQLYFRNSDEMSRVHPSKQPWFNGLRFILLQFLSYVWGETKTKNCESIQIRIDSAVRN